MACNDCGAPANQTRPLLTADGQLALCPLCVAAHGIAPMTVIGLTDQGALRVADYLAAVGAEGTLGDNLRSACRMVEGQLNGQDGHIIDRRGPWYFQADTCNSLALGAGDFMTLNDIGN